MEPAAIVASDIRHIDEAIVLVENAVSKRYSVKGTESRLSAFDGVYIGKEDMSYQWSLNFGYRGEPEIVLIPTGDQTTTYHYYLDQAVEFFQRDDVLPVVIQENGNVIRGEQMDGEENNE
ncbi:hypothetical protein [Natronomonas amylolytica]|uniref:hypothetical protein n=1 Tax=Natronomonas amylolytica TaxID=3108498 RepID=UPI00300B01C4